MLDYGKIQREHRLASCYNHHYYPVNMVGGVPHCWNCGAIVGSVKHLYKIWKRCRIKLGLDKEGHEFAQ
jgi:hypothetical protein